MFVNKRFMFLFIGLAALVVACAGVTGYVEGQAEVNTPLLRAQLKGGIAKVESDMETLRGRWLDKDKKPIGPAFDIPTGLSDHEIPEGAVYCRVGSDEDGDGRSNRWANYWYYTVDGPNFSIAALEAPSGAEADAEFFASMEHTPSPLGSTMLMNVQLRPFGNGDWKVLIAEEEEIVGFEIYKNGKLIADTGDLPISYDPAVGGWVEGIIGKNGKGGGGFLGRLKSLVPQSAPFFPTELFMKIVYYTADDRTEWFEAEYTK